MPFVDEATKQYYYLNVRTGQKHRSTPLILQVAGIQLRHIRVKPNKTESAVRIQNLYRTRRARIYLKATVRDLFEKHYDPQSNTYVYLNSRSGEIFTSRPVCLGDEDIPIETFAYQQTVCKISTISEPRGTSGVLVNFRAIRCILTTASTLPSERIAASGMAMNIV